jgi:predicted membrane protein
VGLQIFLSFLFQKKNHPGDASFSSHGHGCRQNRGGTYTGEVKDGKVDYRCVFGGIEQVIFEPVFKGGTLETVFGGIVLDLRHTMLPEGDTYLYVKTTCGGVEITVPEDWNIEIFPSKSVIGGVNDSRVKTPPRQSERKLIIVAECVFGGLVIK